MTKLLKMALAEVSKLPEQDQDFIAQMILDELADEARWAASFARDRVRLRELAEEARAEYRAGKTTPLDFKRKK